MEERAEGGGEVVGSGAANELGVEVGRSGVGVGVGDQDIHRSVNCFTALRGVVR